MKKVSIIVPAYKCADFIEKNLNMLFEQTYPDTEIIVVNDGSPDNLSEILGKYKNRIKVINKENGGAASARNRGLDEAAGEYIAFIDCDDRIDNDTIEKSVRALEENDADIVRYNLVYEYPDGKFVEHIRLFDKKTIIYKEEYKEKVYNEMMEGIKFNSCIGLYRRDCIGDVRFREDMVTCEDAVFNLYVITKSKKIVFDPQIKYYYFQSGNGLTGGGISVLQKYICNYRYGMYMKQFLPQWGMNTLYYKIKIIKRLVNITIAKLARK